MTTEPQQRVRDLGAEKRAELLTALFHPSSPRGHLRGDATVRGPLEPTDFLAHVRGESRLGAVPFVDAERVTWGAIDLDFRNWGLESDDPEAVAVVDGIVQALALRSIRAVPERSRSKGWHVWIFLDRPVQAIDLRELLRGVALDAGARDEADLVCPRQDSAGDGIGNGTYLPLFGGDREPFTRFHQWNEDGDLLPIDNGDLAGFLRDLAEHRSPADRVPPAKKPSEPADASDDGHPCAWILDELAEAGIRLEGVVLLDRGNPDRARITCACPIHEAAKKRIRGGSCIIRADGRGRCFSTKCDKRWRNLAELIDLAGGAKAATEPVHDMGSLALDLSAMRGRPVEKSPLPGLLPSEPALVVLVSRPKVGKTRLGLTLAQAGAAGAAPWPEAPALELRHVGVVEAEEPAADTLRTLDALAVLAMPKRIQWERGLMLFARDPLLDHRAEALLRLDHEGLPLLRSLARECDLLVLDSLSRLKPPGVEERDNDHMTALLDELQRIASEERCYLILLHHEGHADRDDPVSAGRGASAISAVARCIWQLDRVPGEPRQRRLRVRGNSVPDAEILFEIAGEDANPEGTLLYWRPIDPLGGIAVEDVLPEIGSECTTSDLARAVSGCGRDEKPSGRASRQAAALRRRWKREGVVEVLEGARGALLLRRIR